MSTAIHDGDEVEIELSSAQPLCLEVIQMNMLSRPSYIAAKSMRIITPGCSLDGDPAILADDAFDAKLKVLVADLQEMKRTDPSAKV